MILKILYLMDTAGSVIRISIIKAFEIIGEMKESIKRRFCACIKKVRKTIKSRKNSTKEQGAIAVCVKSVLQSKGKTLKKFTCKRNNQGSPNVIMQSLLKKK